MCIRADICNDYEEELCDLINKEYRSEPTCFEKKPLIKEQAPASVLFSDGLDGLVQMWQERASALWEASEAVRSGNSKLADELDASGLAYEQCAEELSKLNKAV